MSEIYRSDLEHDEGIKRVCKDIRSLIKNNRSVRIQKDGVPHLVPNPNIPKHSDAKINIKGFNHILQLNPQERTCVAESGLTFFDLVNETLKHNLIPLTVPELKGITIGGAVSGCSVESMSFKYGGFHDSCIEYEIITGEGERLICSKEENAQIFDMVHGSYGTLGVITKIKFKLMPAKPYVRMTYFKFDRFDLFWDFLKKRCEVNDHDFIDAIVHAPDEFVVCAGDMVDSAPYLSSYDWLKIFYRSTRKKQEDYLRTIDYFFRYDTECHWLTSTVPLLETKPARLLLGKMILGSTNLIRWSERLSPLMKLKRRPDVVVDVFIPQNKFKEFFEWYAKDYKYFPLWVVPYKPPVVYPWIGDKYSKGMENNFFIDCAVYGKKNSEPNIDYSQVLEEKTIELGGIKTLISRNHFDADTFWKVYNRPNYDAVKSKTDPHNIFNNLFDKMVG